MLSNEHGLMPTIFSERIFAGFEKELGSCADELGIPRAIFHRPDIEYPVESFYRLLECGARKGYPHIGFSVGSTLKLADLGALAHAMRASPTVGYALNLAAQYYYVATHGAIFRADTGKDILLISYQSADLHSSLHPQDLELSVSLFANMVRELSGMPINPLKVEFTHSLPEYSNTLQSYFNCKIYHNRRVNRLHYPRYIVDLPVLTADASLLEALEFFLADRLKVRREDDLLCKVEHLISVSLSEGTPSMTSIAATLGMSKRTLHRRLSEAGVVFVDLVDEIRRVIGIDYVKFSECSFTDVALILGYSELSAFSRAFRRWTGSNPQQVRDESLSKEMTLKQ
jgi:AraC-like DNA-binding protein